MRLRSSLLALFLLAGSASARNFTTHRRAIEPPPAATSTIRFAESEDSNVDRVLRGGGSLDLSVAAVEASDTETSSLVTMDLAVKTSSENTQFAGVTIDLPLGARVVGMMLTAGGTTWKAEELTPTEGNDRYERETSRMGDPALLMWKGSGETEQLVLHVAPIRNDHPATVTLQIMIPRSEQVDIVTGAKRQRVRTARRATDADLASFAEHAGVNTRAALYAGPPLDRAPTRAEIQRMLRRSRPEFRACYHNAPERERTHEVVLSFTVSTSGRIASTVENASVQLASCITAEVNSWRFDRNAESVSVRYPITFVPF